jgi:N-acetylmuramoyl-L-alanine amidase
MVIATALLCLTANLYYEARGEVVMGEHAVAQVTMNRADRDPKKICEVVAAPKQFSWTNKSMGLVKHVDGHLVLTAKGEPKDVDAWERAKKIAVVTLNGRMTDFTHGANHYHASYVNPSWKHSMAKVAVIGHHLFYRYNA